MAHYIEHATKLAPLSGVDRTGQAYTKQGFAIYRLENGLMREGWNQEDDLGFMRQLGVTEYALAEKN